MNLAESWAWIEGFTNFERRPADIREYRLDRMRTLLDLLDNPQNNVRAIHVAGSKGKGSVASLLATGLQAAGFKTFLYRSPHIRDYRERLTLAGQFLPEETYKEAIGSLRLLVESAQTSGRLTTDPTTFELLTVLGFLLAAQTGCDIQVLETGLGGRLDATNVVLPICSVITALELEHTDILGDTIEQIAAEKAGILKQGIPAFSLPQVPAASSVLDARAAALGTSIVYPLGRSSDALPSLKASIKLDWSGAAGTVLGRQWFCEVPGKVHLLNLVFSQVILERLADLLPMSAAQFVRATKAMSALKIPGRMETTQLRCSKGRVRAILDGAHTRESAAILRDNLVDLLGRDGRIPDSESIVLVLGVVAGKNIRQIAEALVPLSAKIYVTTPGSFKASNPRQVFEACRAALDSTANRYSPALILEPDARSAVLLALDTAAEEGRTLVITGSFYLLGEAESALENHR